MGREPHRVFVYGTLTDPDRVDVVLDDWRFEGAAELCGLHRVEGRYPTLAPGGRTGGTRLVTPELAALDAYEGVDRGLYVRVAVPMADAGETGAAGAAGSDAGSAGEAAWVYVGHPERIGAVADWPGEGPLADRIQGYVEEHAVYVRRVADR